MKRSLPTETGSPIKRQCVSHASQLPFDDAKQERTAIDIYKNVNDDGGYISGKIFMIWPVMGKKLKAIFEEMPQDQGGHHKFDVEFTGACADHFEELCFKTQDEVLLALKGARVELHGSQISTLKMKLQYNKGAMVKLVKRRGDLQPINKIINTWIQKQSPPSNLLNVPEAEDWFSTPRCRTPSEPTQNLSSVFASTPPLEESSPVKDCTAAAPSSAARADQQPLPSVSTDSDDPFTDQGKYPQSCAPHSSVSRLVSQTDHPVELLTKKQQRRLKRKQKQEMSKARISPQPSTECATIVKKPESACTPRTSMKDVSPPAPSLPSTESKLPTSNAENPSTPHTGEPTPTAKRSGLTGPKPGLITSRGDNYPAINTLKKSTIVHMIGVVISVTEPSITSKGHRSCSLKIVDPSRIIVEDLSIYEGFKINCFTETYSQWLPCPSLNDIIILRNIKVGEWNGLLNGVGYADRLQWAVYSTKNGKVTHGDLQDVPRFQGLAGGFSGQPYSPFFEPTEEEIRYCLKLFDWWQELEKYQEKLRGEGHQVQVSSCIRAQREHRLISIVNPSIPPQGYFDCTVEVWYVHLNDNGVYSLYVTDYTANSSTMPCSQQWCPPRLSDHIFKVEVWDNAIDLVKTMRRGEFYRIKNLRAVISTGGYLEGKLVESKIERLEEAATSHNRPLKALIERKKEWEEVNPPTTNTFEFSLISNVSVNQHFTCAVEVVHVVPERGYMCVTDYTSRAELSSFTSHEPWAAGRHGLVLKILLQEGQVEMSKVVAKGEYYLINNLRLKPSTVASQFLGYLGGDDNLINKINVKKDNDKLEALLLRKAQWEKAQSQVQTSESAPRLVSSPSPATLTRPTAKPGYTTINEIIVDEKSTNKFRLEARVVDFYPPDSYDWVTIHCTQCKNDLPRNRLACTGCNDNEYKFRRFFYQLFFVLEDEHGHRLQVSVNDNCSLFKDLDRVDIRLNRKAYEALCTRIEPVFGSLEKALSERANNALNLSTTPMVTLIINSWEVEGEQKKAYCVASVKGRESSA